MTTYRLRRVPRSTLETSKTYWSLTRLWMPVGAGGNLTASAAQPWRLIAVERVAKEE